MAFDNLQKAPTQLHKNAVDYILLGMLLALCVRLIFLLFVQRVDWDGFFYLIYAKNIRAGDWLAPSPLWTPYPPGYPAVVALLSFLGLSWEQAGIGVSLIAGVILIAPVVHIAYLLGERTVALITALLVALNPWLVYVSIAVLSESLFIFLFALLLWLWVVKARGKKIRGHSVWTFLLCCLLVIVRPIGIAFLVGWILAVVLLDENRQRAVVLPLAIALFVTLIYFIFSQTVSSHLQSLVGRPQPSYFLQEMSRGLVQFYRDDLPQSARLTTYQPPAALEKFLAENAPFILKRYVYLALEHISEGFTWTENGQMRTIIPLYLLPLVGIGLWANRGEKWRLVPMAAVLPYPLLTIPFVDDPRYAIPLLPVVLVYVASGVCALLSQGNRRLGMVTIGLLLFLSAIQMYQYNFHVFPVPPDPYKELGLWLNEHEKPDLVLDTHPAVAFYAESRLEWLDEGNLATQLSGLSRRNRGRVVVIIRGDLKTRLAESNASTLTPIRTDNALIPSSLKAYRLNPE